MRTVSKEGAPTGRKMRKIVAVAHVLAAFGTVVALSLIHISEPTRPY